jgi:hypothetical protein
MRAWRAVGALLALGALVLPMSQAGAGGDDDADALLAFSRKVSANDTFAGVVEVKWTDEQGESHVVRVGARSVRGRFVVGMAEHHVIGQGFERFTTSADDVDARWIEGQGHIAPPPGESWDLELGRRREVAGREARIVLARDDDGHVRARFAIDHERGQLLRREILDRHGRVVHSVGFVKIVTGPITPAVPSTPKTATAAPTKLEKSPGGYLAPEDVDGYRLLGVYRHPDGLVQMYYGDGLFTLSLFEQSGAVDWKTLPAGVASVTDLRDRTYVTAVGTVVVWQHGDLTCTVVGDGPADSVTAAVQHLAGIDDSSWLDDVGDFLLGPFSWK